MVGMVTQSIPVGNNTHLNIIMQQEATALEEVVVGYGTQSNKDLTAPIVKVGGDDLRNSYSMPCRHYKEKPRVFKLSIAEYRAVEPPLKSNRFHWRLCQPLFVVDGVFVDNIDLFSDIEDITILKDIGKTRNLWC